MNRKAPDPTPAKLPAWQMLEAHCRKVRDLHLLKLFADDPGRGERTTAEAVGIYYDYSKHRVTDETMKLLLQLAEESGLRVWAGAEGQLKHDSSTNALIRRYGRPNHDDHVC